MKTTKKQNIKGIETYLPFFKGFYGSGLDEPDFEGEAEHFGLPKKFDFIPYVNQREYQTELSKEITSRIENSLIDAGFVQKINFQNLVSPKEYNFKNDSIDCIIYPKKQAIKNFIYDNKDKFVQYLEERLKSRSGFISFHSYHFEDWEQETKGFTDYTDERGFKLGFLLDFICEVYEFDSDLNELIAEDCICNVHISEFYTDNFNSLVGLLEESRDFINVDILEDAIGWTNCEEINQVLTKIKEHVQRFYTLDLNVKESTVKEFEQVEIGKYDLTALIDLNGFIDKVMNDIASHTMELELK